MLILLVLLCLLGVVISLIFAIINGIQIITKKDKDTAIFKKRTLISVGGIVLSLILISVFASLLGQERYEETEDDTPIVYDDGNDEVADVSADATEEDVDDLVDDGETANHMVNWSEERNGTKFVIDQIFVQKKTLDSFDGSGDTFDGAIVVHYIIENGSDQDITTYASQGTLLTNTGEQIDADVVNSESFDGDIMTGAKKEGSVVYPVKELSDPNEITDVRIQWNFWPNKDEITAANDFDIKIDL